MKKLLLFVTLLLVGAGVASANVGDMPPSDALSYGKNAQGCYYTSASKLHVYSEDFTLMTAATNSCDGTFRPAQWEQYINSAIGQWRAKRIEFLKTLAAQQ